MKFPSLQTLLHSTLVTIRRFPLAIFFMFAGCFYGIRVIHLEYDNQEKHYYFTNIIWSAYLGMLLSLVVTIFGERKNFSSKYKWLFAVATLALVIAYYFSLPDHFIEPRLKQIVLFAVGLHLLVAFIPFTSKGEVNGFWQYNKTLFLHALAAALYASVLYAGLALALLAIENLFSVHINYKWFADLWVCMSVGFSTIFFLAGFPIGFEKLELNTDYPKGLKIFTQYVLIPLISVYLIILYAYMFKILGTRQWPYGWVSYLVLAFAIAGILSLLLIHPIRNDAHNKWMLAFSKFFYFAICPLIVLLFLAIERRVSDYGITEDRYFILVLSCWLAFIALYFIFSKTKNIKVIPISLCILVFCSSFGPWGAFHISLKSQSRRLKEIFQANNLLSENQKLIPARGKLRAGDASQIRSIVYYLVNAHGYKSLQPFFTQNLDLMMAGKTGKSYYSYEQSEKLLGFIKIDKSENEQLTDNYSRYSRIYAEKGDSMMTTAGYEYLIPGFGESANEGSTDSLINMYKGENRTLHIEFVKESGKLFLHNSMEDPLVFDISALVRSVKKNDFDGENNSFPLDSLTLTGQNKEVSVKCIFREISFAYKDDSLNFNGLTADLLIHFKNTGK